MKRKDSKEASPKATPFFARYLEGQDAEARVNEGRGQSNFTYKEDARGTKKGGAKKGAAKSAAAGGDEAKRPPLQTLKYPSDRDELVFYAYHAEAAETKATARHTLKYPSDNDEDSAYYAVYSNAAEAPKSETAKAKPKETGVRLSRRKPKG